jgi:hypothetical protein
MMHACIPLFEQFSKGGNGLFSREHLKKVENNSFSSILFYMIFNLHCAHLGTFMLIGTNNALLMIAYSQNIHKIFKNILFVN